MPTPPKEAVIVTPASTVTAGGVKTTVEPVVLSSDPLVTDQVIVPPETSADPYFTAATKTISLPEVAEVLDGETTTVVLLGYQEGAVM